MKIMLLFLIASATTAQADSADTALSLIKVFSEESQTLTKEVLSKKDSTLFIKSSKKHLLEAQNQIKDLRWVEGPSTIRGRHIIEITEKHLKIEIENVSQYKGKINRDKSKKLADILKKLNSSRANILKTLKAEIKEETGSPQIPTATPIIDKSPFNNDDSLEDKEGSSVWDR